MAENNNYDQIINNVTTQCSDINKRVISFQNGSVTILFVKQLTDITMLSEYIIKPIMKNASMITTFTAEKVASKIISPSVSILSLDENTIVEKLMNGMTVILFSWESKLLSCDIKKVEKKDIGTPELTYSIRGPKDCFTEILDVNISLIRYRIKDPQLKIDMFEVGKRTKARIAVIYINDIVNNKIINDIESRINSIDTDGILESGELQILLQGKRGFYPQIGLAERSDLACGALLEGKAVIIAEGSGIALIAPKTFAEFLWSSDDQYDNKYFAAFMKILRAGSLILSLTLGSLYIALVSFHADLLPADYILTLAKLRSDVPVNAFTGILFLEILLLIVREALLRVPKQIGSAIGIVGAIIIGQAAISSNVFDPLSLIIVSISFLASFAIPDYSITTPFYILKFMLMVATATLGLFGFTLGICVIITSVVSENSFGVPYTAPYAPFNLTDAAKVMGYSKNAPANRPDFLQTKDNTRGAGRK